MAGVTIVSSGQPPDQPGALQPGRAPVAGRLVALARAVERSRRRQWDVRQIMLVVGATLMVLGFLFIFLGWWGAANSAYLFKEIPYLISGGLGGLALVAGGGFVFFAAWLVRMIEENRNHNARLSQTLDRVDRMLGFATNGSEADVPAPATGTGSLPPPPPHPTAAPAPPSSPSWGDWR